MRILKFVEYIKSLGPEVNAFFGLCCIMDGINCWALNHDDVWIPIAGAIFFGLLIQSENPKGKER